MTLSLNIAKLDKSIAVMFEITVRIQLSQNRGSATTAISQAFSLKLRPTGKNGIL
jgi:hypothetical protein